MRRHSRCRREAAEIAGEDHDALPLHYLFGAVSANA